MADEGTAPAALLPEGLGAAVEAESGARLAAVRPRGGGGASRSGAELTLAWPDGTRREAYMNYDVHKAGAGDDAAFLREAAIIRALSGPLKDAGVRAAPLIAAIADLRALVCEKAPGEANFHSVRDPARRSAIAADFMRQVARLHAVDPAAVPELGRPSHIAEIAAERIATLREMAEWPGANPLIRMAVEWLESHIPAEPERLAIVHGDAGAGNFMFEGETVTAVLDWELVHIGDPMADLAMMALRDLFQPLVPLPEAFAAYAAAGGAPVSLERVRFWRLLFQTGFAGRSRHDDPTAPPPPNLGMNMVYSMVHRRVLAEALAEAEGITLEPVALPDVPPGERDRSFGIALDDLRDVIVPRLADQQAAVKAKGLARLVKWWRSIERYGPAFTAAEKAELENALGERFADLASARAAFAKAVASDGVDRRLAIRLAHARVARENALMADAMGGLADTHFSALE